MRARSGTVTSSRKDYFIEITFIRIPTALNRRSTSKNAFYDLINSLIFSSIKKAFAIIADEFNTIDEFNNVITEASDFEDTFKKFIFTPLSIMSEDINHQKTKFIEQ